MNKLSVLSLGLLFISNTAVVAQDINTEKLAQVFSKQYGAPVEVVINADSCVLKFPAVEIKEEKNKFVPSPTNKEEVKVETKTEITPIAATELTCRKINDYNGKAQYKVENSSPNRLIAQIYNLSTLSFLKDVEMKTYTEEFNFVPELGLISATKRNIIDATYVEKDEETGLKKEIGNLRNLTSNEEISESGENIKYRIDATFDMFNLDFSLGTVQIKNMRQAADAEYRRPQTTEFDYTKLLHNYAYLLSSRSRVAVQGVKIDLPLFGTKVAFDVDTKGNIALQPDSNMKIDGNTIINNIALNDNVPEFVKQLRTIAMKYVITDISQQAVGKLADLQEKAMADENAVNEEEFARILDELFDTSKVHMDVKFLYANASISGSADYQKKNGYLNGTAKIVITNLYNILPEAKMCANNPRADEMPECAMILGLGQAIDITKNNSEINFRYDEKGLYKNGTKVGEPIELNFHKMWLENKAQEQLNTSSSPSTAEPKL